VSSTTSRQGALQDSHAGQVGEASGEPSRVLVAGQKLGITRGRQLPARPAELPAAAQARAPVQRSQADEPLAHGPQSRLRP
jgi:hypothetical protein